MVSSLLLLAAAATTAFASPLPEPVLLLPRQSVGACRNQSCLVATVSGSTGATVYPYRDYPVGDTAGGDCCIVRYFPAAKDAIYANRQGLQGYCAANGGDAPLDSNPPGVTKVSLQYPPPNPAPTAGQPPVIPPFPFENPFASINFPRSGPCKSKILIYIKGTFETGDLGNLIGNDLKNALGSDWEVRGVQYNNGLDQNYCLGLPGGKTARGVFVDAYNSCPGSTFAIAGYSQGAMAARHLLARAPAAAVARVKSLTTWGDPFNGAPIGQYNGPTHVYCDAGDGVCSGQLNITPQHLGYGGTVQGAAAQIKKDVA